MKILICTNGLLRTPKVMKYLSRKMLSGDEMSWWELSKNKNELCNIRTNEEIQNLLLNSNIEVLDYDTNQTKKLRFTVVNLSNNLKWKIEEKECGEGIIILGGLENGR